MKTVEKSRLAAKIVCPSLISLKDIRGDLHCHTDDSDGHNSLDEMVREAERRGYAYIAVTNHTGSLKIARGLETDDVKRLLEKNRAL